MRFNSTHDWRRSIGTSLRGWVTAPYGLMVDTFGEPEIDDFDKSQGIWTLQFEDGTIATIYDYKSYVPLESVREWHIGGFTSAAVDRVAELLPDVDVRRFQP